MGWLSDIQKGIEDFNTGIGTGIDWLVDRTGDVGAGLGNVFSGRDWMDDDENTSKFRNDFYNATSGDTFATPVSIAEDLGIGALGAVAAPFTAGASVPIAGGLLAAKTAGENGQNIEESVTGKDQEGNDISPEERIGKGAMALGSTALAGLGGGALTKAGGKAATKATAKNSYKTNKELTERVYNMFNQDASKINKEYDNIFHKGINPDGVYPDMPIFENPDKLPIDYPYYNWTIESTKKPFNELDQRLIKDRMVYPEESLDRLMGRRREWTSIDDFPDVRSVADHQDTLTRKNGEMFIDEYTNPINPFKDDMTHQYLGRLRDEALYNDIPISSGIKNFDKINLQNLINNPKTIMNNDIPNFWSKLYNDNLIPIGIGSYGTGQILKNNG